jgi:hypothetical protein
MVADGSKQRWLKPPSDMKNRLKPVGDYPVWVWVAPPKTVACVARHSPPRSFEALLGRCQGAVFYIRPAFQCQTTDYRFWHE